MAKSGKLGGAKLEGLRSTAMPASYRTGGVVLQDESVVKFLQKHDQEQFKKLLMLIDDRPILAGLRKKLIEMIKSAPN